jgi:Flp pilus assembly protein TadD
MSDLVSKSMKVAVGLVSEGRLEESEAICRQVLRVDADNSDAMCLLSFCLQRSGREEEASELTDKAAYIMGCESKVRNHLGISCMHARDLKSAHEHFALASEINTSDSDAPFNAGSCALMEGRPKDALYLFRESYARSKSHKSMVGMACAKTEMLDVDGAISLLKMVIESDPDDTGAKSNMASVLHLAGRWDEAWSFYPSRLRHYEHLSRRIEKMGLPSWSGDDPEGRSILVFSEQGLGDALNFWRFVPELKRRFPGSRIELLVPNELRKIVGRQGVDVTENTEGFDLCCSLMDIPGLLKIGRDEVERSFVRLETDAKCDMSAFGSAFKVGVCWAGNPAHPQDMWRSCRLGEFAALDMPGVKLFSIQKDLRPRVWPHSPEPVDLSADCGGLRLVNMSPHMNSWEDTAAIISSLDLVVSVDTSVMHLAAAMGKETWGLLQYVPDWRWGLGSDRTCWYPTLRLFRQDSSRSWGSVFSAVRNSLVDKLVGPKP